MLRTKSAGFPNGVFFWRSPEEFLTQDIQKWRCQRSMVVRAVELWLTMHTLDWQRGGPNTLNSTKLLFSMDSASPWAAKIVGNEFCHGFGKLRRNVWELRRQLLVMFPLVFFSGKTIKKKPNLGSKPSHKFKCTSLPLGPNVVHTYRWKWRSPKNDYDVAPGITP